MINPEYPLASWFLAVAATFFLVVYALPLLFAPLQWARWFRWGLPSGRPDLTIYLGRCVGVVALAVIVIAYQGVSAPREHRIVFELIGLICGFMTGLHAWGAIRRSQPWTETAEIFMYAIVAVVAFWLHAALI